jgi:hypothetical protein
MAMLIRPNGAEFFASKVELIRWQMPYDKWACADGREVLFDRDQSAHAGRAKWILRRKVRLRDRQIDIINRAISKRTFTRRI